jgi:hypothetical protein
MKWVTRSHVHVDRVEADRNTDPAAPGLEAIAVGYGLPEA